MCCLEYGCIDIKAAPQPLLDMPSAASGPDRRPKHWHCRNGECDVQGHVREAEQFRKSPNRCSRSRAQKAQRHQGHTHRGKRAAKWSNRLGARTAGLAFRCQIFLFHAPHMHVQARNCNHATARCTLDSRSQDTCLSNCSSGSNFRQCDVAGDQNAGGPCGCGRPPAPALCGRARRPHHAPVAENDCDADWQTSLAPRQCGCHC